MAFYKEDIVDINLNSGNIFRSFLNHAIGYKDDDADRFGIRAFRDGEPVDLSGASCQAVFMAPNGTNIALTSYGTVSGNVAYVTLPQACYDYEGQFCLAIKLVGGGVTGTVRIVDGTVTRTGASGTVAPTASVPTYQEILAVYADMQEDIADYESVVANQNDQINSLKSALGVETIKLSKVYLGNNANITNVSVANEGQDISFDIITPNIPTIGVYSQTMFYEGKTYVVSFDISASVSDPVTLTTDFGVISFKNSAHYDFVYSPTGGNKANIFYTNGLVNPACKITVTNFIVYELINSHEPSVYPRIINIQSKLDETDEKVADNAENIEILNNNINDVKDIIGAEKIKQSKIYLPNNANITNIVVSDDGHNISFGIATPNIPTIGVYSETMFYVGKTYIISFDIASSVSDPVTLTTDFGVISFDGSAHYDFVYSPSDGNKANIFYTNGEINPACTINVTNFIVFELINSHEPSVYPNLIKLSEQIKNADERIDTNSENIENLSEKVGKISAISESGLFNYVEVNDAANTNMKSLTVDLGEATADSVEITVRGKNVFRFPTQAEISSAPADMAGYKILPIKVKPNTPYHLKTVFIDGYTCIGKYMYILITNNLETNFPYLAVAHNDEDPSTDPILFEGTIDSSIDGYLYLRMVVPDFTLYDVLIEKAEAMLETGSKFTEYKEPQYTTSIVDLANSSGTVIVPDPQIELLHGYNFIYSNVGKISVTYFQNDTLLVENSQFKFTDYALQQITNSLSVGLPVLYLYGDIDGMTKEQEVSVAYKYENLSGNCTLKWQGQSSLSLPKKNYTIKFSSKVDFNKGWGSNKKYVLKANYIDFTHSRNVASCKLWGQLVKSRETQVTELYNLPNGGAIDGFPVIVALNDKFFGLYTLNMPKDAWMFGMSGSSEHEGILGAENHSNATNFKATITTESLEAEEYFACEYAPDESDIGWMATSVSNAIQHVIDTHSANDFESIRQYIDVPSAIDYYIFTCLLGGIDLTDKNYLLATFNGTKWYFSAYDLDSVLGNNWDGGYYIAPSNNPTFASYATLNRMMYVIYTYDRQELIDRYRYLRNHALSIGNVLTVFYNFEHDIPEAVRSIEMKKWTSLPGTSTDNISQIVEWYRARTEILDAEIDALDT